MPSIMRVRDHMLLALAAQHYRHEALRTERARDELGYTATAYAAALNRLLDRPDALAADPNDRAAATPTAGCAASGTECAAGRVGRVNVYVYTFSRFQPPQAAPRRPR